VLASEQRGEERALRRCEDRVMRRTWGTAGGPVAVLLPGSGSTADFVTRAFGPPLADVGYALVTADPVAGPDVAGPDVAGPDVVAATLAALAEAAHRFPVRLAGGVSLGAQLAVRWAAGSPAAARLNGLLLALPAWSGPPGEVAAASANAAAEVEAHGVAAALRQARGGGVGWVLDELTAAWPRYGAALPAVLRAAAASAGPTAAELARIVVPVGLAAFVDDPLHPLAVAEEWAAGLRHAAVERLHLADPGPDRTVLGAAALRALHRAAAGSVGVAVPAPNHDGR
jgi:pimeloyl-ACP methyl ester carboxylesterase